MKYKYKPLEAIKVGDVVQRTHRTNPAFTGDKLYKIRDGLKIKDNSGAIYPFGFEDLLWRCVVTKTGYEAVEGDTIFVIKYQGGTIKPGNILRLKRRRSKNEWEVDDGCWLSSESFLVLCRAPDKIDIKSIYEET